MKSITILLSSLLLTLGLSAKELSSNSTQHQYSKPGAAIDMSYTSEKVDINETSDVNITLSTPITQGTISVLITLEEDLSSLIEFDEKLSFEVHPNEQDFLINLQVKSEIQGLYYIRLLTKVKKAYGTKLRSFAIPVYVGESEKILSKSISSSMKALGSGENISVSKAIETIKILKTK